MGAEHLPKPFVPALAQQVTVEFAQRRHEAVSVRDDLDVIERVGHHEPVVGEIEDRDQGAEDVLAHGFERMVATTDPGGDLLGPGAQCPDDRPLRMRMGPEHRVRIVVLTGGEQVEVLRSRAVASARNIGARRLGRHGHDCLL